MNNSLKRQPKQSGFEASNRGQIRRVSQSLTGFTIVELLIASAVFSVVLILCTTAMLQIGRVYYKGITSSQTQEAARSIMDEITRSIQFSGGTIVGTTGSPDDRFCAGGKKYNVKRGFQLANPVTDNADEATKALIVYDAPACGNFNLNPSLPNGTPPPRELLAPNMRIAKLEVVSLGNSLYRVTIRVVYGDREVLNPAKDACSAERAGTQFCAVSELSTTVQKRVK